MTQLRIYEDISLRDTRKISNTTELLNFLREKIDRNTWASVDLFLFSDDLDSFFFPAGTNGEPDETYRNLLMSLKNSFVNIRPAKENQGHFKASMSGGISGEFELFPLVNDSEFLGFLFLLYSPGSVADEKTNQYAGYLSSLCENTLHLQALKQTTEKLELENRLIRDKLIKAENLKLLGEMIGGITHDFNNIFTGVIGYSQLIQMMTEDEDTIDSVNEILSAANVGKERIAFLQETKKIDPSEPALSVNFAMEIEDAAKNMESNISHFFPGKKWTDIFNFHWKEIPSRKMPKVQFKQFFMMIFDRLMKLGRDVITVSGESQDEKIFFSITGSKTGEEVGAMPLILESFDDFPSCTILFCLANQLGLNFEILPDRVKVEMDLTHKEQEVPKLRDFEGKKVFVFESDRTVSGMLNSMFKKMGIHAEITGDLKDVRKLSEGDSSQYDRILLDLPAYPILKEIAGELKNPSVVLTSAWGPLMDMPSIDEKIVNAILLKPFNVGDLVRILQ